MYFNVVSLWNIIIFQIKLNLSVKTSATAGDEGGEEVRGVGAMMATSEPIDTQAVDELKRAFELVEASSPGLSDLITQKVVSHLQKWYVKVCSGTSK